MIELKPCPFCGGKVKPAATKRAGHDIYFSITCHCGLEYSDQCATAEDLHRNWNRRPDSTHIVSESATGFGFICQGNNFRGGCEPHSAVIRTYCGKVKVVLGHGDYCICGELSPYPSDAHLRLQCKDCAAIDKAKEINQ